MGPHHASTQRFEIKRYRRDETPGQVAVTQDELAVEQPLEIRVLLWERSAGSLRQRRTRIAVTMRTPGYDRELAAGFLFNEGLLRARGDLLDMREGDGWIELELARGCAIDPARLERNFPISSSCGVCGKQSIDSVTEQTRHCDWSLPGSGPFVPTNLIITLPEVLRQAQAAFDRTGGLHAAGIFTLDGKLLRAREDVGRHNALDKIIGAAFLSDALPLDQTILVLSGRVSFELVQKAAMAGIRIIAAVGAPSSLAVELARELELTIAGFVRDGRLNIYHGDWRIIRGRASMTPGYTDGKSSAKVPAAS